MDFPDLVIDARQCAERLERGVNAFVEGSAIGGRKEEGAAMSIPLVWVPAVAPEDRTYRLLKSSRRLVEATIALLQFAEARDLDLEADELVSLSTLEASPFVGHDEVPGLAVIEVRDQF